MTDLKLDFEDDESFWINCMGQNDKKELVINGRVQISINVTPIEMAKSNPVGTGRSEPNHSPFLPPPVGRIKFSLNPIANLMQLVGPALRRKIYMYCCLAVCCALCIALFPLIISNVVSQGITKMFFG